jgi:hypothetical protein
VTAPGGDPIVRIERRALLFTAVAMAAAWFVPSGGARATLGVGGGAILAFVSFWLIKRGVDGLAARVQPAADPADPADSPRPSSARPRGFGLFVLRYALLAGISYVMIARLRLPPIGLLCGASVTMLAAAAELIPRRPS